MVYAKNKKAYFDYEIIEKIEAGIELVGVEVKSIKESKLSIKESFIRIIKNEVYIANMNVNDYTFGNIHNVDNKRLRKLLFHKKEILNFKKKIQENNMVLVPLSIYSKGRHVKVEVGIAKPKKNYDKRETIKKRDVEREIKKSIKNMM